jgi:NADPH:quinone reductase-like Zn-dependent oxidoreductase
MIKKTPALFGHEWAGTVEGVGEGVAHVRVGDRVVAANSARPGLLNRTSSRSRTISLLPRPPWSNR